MSPLTPPTLTRLDSRYPLLWRDEHTVQFGLEGAVRVSVDEPWVEPLLQQLRTGIRRGAFDLVAHGVGAPRAAARRMLETLRPVLVRDSPLAPPVWIDDLNIPDGRVVERLRQALDDEGIEDAPRGTADAVAVVVVGGAAAALQLAPYLRDDIPHLAVGFEPEAATIGPLVVPGHSPCLSCRDAHEQQRDPAWPALHAQLVGRTVTIGAARVAHAATLIARVLRTPTPETGVMARVSPDGRVVWRSVRHHEECRCREMSSRSRPGSATAPAPLDPPIETSSQPAFARPA